MPKRSLDSLGMLVKSKRSSNKIRSTAQEIGIGHATLLRVESGHMPDLDTFGKICNWLGISPSEFLGGPNDENAPQHLVISAHFRAAQTPKRETAEALAKMILLAAKMQPSPDTDRHA